MIRQYKLYFSVILSLFSLFLSCESEDLPPVQLPQLPDNPVDTTVSLDNTSVSESSELILTSFDQLNRTQKINSHKGVIERSRFTPIYGTFNTVDSRLTKFSIPLYPRLVRADDGTWLLTFHYGDGGASAGNEVLMMKSRDLIDWSAAEYLYQCSGGKPFYAGAHLLRLSDGRIMAAAAYRRTTGDYHYTFDDNGIVLRFSSDNGLTWTGDQRINVGTNWEPFAVELPTGRIQIYYTDCNHVITDIWTGPGAYGGSGIAMIYSDDGGKTWIPGNQSHLHVIRQEIDYKSNYHLYTDQMPAVVVLNDGSRLAAAMESDAGIAKGRSDFHISFAYSETADSWGSDMDSGDAPADRSNMVFKGSAPFLVTFPSGETVLTYNSDCFFMRIGDENARNFGEEKLVFEADSESKGYWGSAARVSDHILVACVGGANNVLQIGQFYLNHAIEAKASDITLDGHSSDWEENKDSFVLCSKGPVSASMRVAQDDERIYFVVEVPDRNLSSGDYFQVFLSPSGSTSLTEKSIRIRGNAEGLLESGIFSGYWKKKPLSVKYHARYDGTLNDGSDTDNGYIAEFSIPKESVHIDSGQILSNFSLKDSDNSSTSEDSLSPVSATSTESWLPILGL